jgi:hypothetical protein
VKILPEMQHIIAIVAVAERPFFCTVSMVSLLSQVSIFAERERKESRAPKQAPIVCTLIHYRRQSQEVLNREIRRKP